MSVDPPYSGASWVHLLQEARILRYGHLRRSGPTPNKGYAATRFGKKAEDLHCSLGVPTFRLLRARLWSTFGVATVAVWTTHDQTCGDLGLNSKSVGICNSAVPLRPA